LGSNTEDIWGYGPRASLGRFEIALPFHNPTLLGLIAVAAVCMTTLARRSAATVRTLRFSFGFLLFLVPLPVSWMTPIIVQLQLLASSVAVELLQRGGVGVLMRRFVGEDEPDLTAR